MQYDFRQIYASVLIDWFETDVSKTDGDLLFKHFDVLPIFRQGVGIKNYKAETLSLMQNYPNPFKDFTTIDYYSPGGRVELNLFDNTGRLIKVLVSADMPGGKYTYNLDGTGLQPGNYYYQLITRIGQTGRNLVKI